MPFPFVEMPRVRYRPALVVSRPWLADRFRLYWGMMVTSAENAGWADDIAIGDAIAEAGLPAPSVIRPAKVASFIEDTARPLGRLPEPLLRAVLGALARSKRLDGREDVSY